MCLMTQKIGYLSLPSNPQILELLYHSKLQRIQEGTETHQLPSIRLMGLRITLHKPRSSRKALSSKATLLISMQQQLVTHSIALQVSSVALRVTNMATSTSRITQVKLTYMV